MGKRTVGKANKGINVEKNNNRFKKLKLKKEKRKKRGKLHRHASGICLQCPSLPTTQLNK